jgi:hypothetical protein
MQGAGLKAGAMTEEASDHAARSRPRCRPASTTRWCRPSRYGAMRYAESFRSGARHPLLGGPQIRVPTTPPSVTPKRRPSGKIRGSANPAPALPSLKEGRCCGETHSPPSTLVLYKQGRGEPPPHPSRGFLLDTLRKKGPPFSFLDVSGVPLKSRN